MSYYNPINGAPASYEDDHEDDDMIPHGAAAWSFPDAREGSQSDAAGQQRRSNKPSRHRSLPRALFGTTGSNSLFGSGPSSGRAGNADNAMDTETPTVMLSQPSQEQVSQIPALSTLPGSSTHERLYEDEVRATVDRRMLPQVEKDADDPTTPLATSRGSIDRQQSTTLTTLSRLFAVQASTSPDVSRHSSYLSGQRYPSTYTRNLHTQRIADLPNHLYTRGLLQGRHSDITVNAFGRQYKLHRLVLDQAPFFTSALSAPWLEAHANEITVRPEDIDPSITQMSFELALKRLYGVIDRKEEDSDAVGLFATGCWLEMQDLIDDSIGSMLRQMTPETISPLIKLVTSNYYGRSGDKILASAKAMLCRDGWRMPLRYWDGIPGDIVREIVGGDGFFIDGEWDRWVLAKRILDRRLRARAIEAGLVEPGTMRKVKKVPDAASLMAVRFDGVYRKSSAGRGVSEALQPWVTPYTHPDIEPILVLLDEGIHYIHLDFEQLQYIRCARDSLGLPVMPEKVITNALWQQMELRQRVLNAKEKDMELSLSVKCSAEEVATGASRDTTMSITTPSEPPDTKGKQRATDSPDDADQDIDSGSWDGNGKPRKFWIPSSDCNIVMGGSADPVIATANNTEHHTNRLSATLQPEDIQWASDFAAITTQPRPPSATADRSGDTMPDVRYSHFPPFRFAAEFPNPRLLKEKKRVYSRTVFYAGSLWNIYIQKVATTRNKQLGVYLHRAKERETEEVVAGTAGLAQGSVDERIGQLEREMILRSERRERRQRRRMTMGSDEHEADGADSSGSAGDQDHALPGASNEGMPARAGAMRGLLGRRRERNSQKAGHTDVGVTGASAAPAMQSLFSYSNATFTPDSDSEDEDDQEDLETERVLETARRSHIPTLPPYVDARPTIKTYFKIYSPSRGGRMLSVYESAPDRFNFSQSWGWKSSTLMLDEGLLGDDMEESVVPQAEDSTSPGATSVLNTEKTKSMYTKGRGDGKLRFMVVIGNI